MEETRRDEDIEEDIIVSTIPVQFLRKRSTIRHMVPQRRDQIEAANMIFLALLLRERAERYHTNSAGADQNIQKS